MFVTPPVWGVGLSARCRRLCLSFPREIQNDTWSAVRGNTSDNQYHRVSWALFCGDTDTYVTADLMYCLSPDAAHARVCVCAYVCLSIVCVCVCLSSSFYLYVIVSARPLWVYP